MLKAPLTAWQCLVAVAWAATGAAGMASLAAACIGVAAHAPLGGPPAELALM